MLLKKFPKRTSFTTDAAQALQSLINFILTPDTRQNLQITETQDEDERHLCSQVDLQRQDDRNWERCKDEIGENIDCYRM
jgi:hypothetical protein